MIEQIRENLSDPTIVIRTFFILEMIFYFIKILLSIILIICIPVITIRISKILNILRKNDFTK